MRLVLKHFLILRAVVVLLLLFPILAQADHSVRPLVVDLNLEPRGQSNETITITNPTNRVERVYATVNKVAVSDDGTISEFTRPSESDNRVTPTSWFSVSRARIEVPPGEQYELPVRVQVHPQAEPGVYHVLVGIASGRNRPTAEERVRTGTAPGTLFRVEIADDRTAYLQLRSFSTDRLLSNASAGSFSYTIENPSDTTLVPLGEVIIYDNRGREVSSIPANPDQTQIEPGSSHSFTQPLIGTLTWGQHRAHLFLSYGDGQRAALTDTIFFYHIPLFWLITIFAVLLIISVSVAYWLHRRYYAPALAYDEVASIPLQRRAKPTRPACDTDVEIASHDHEQSP